MHLQAEGDRLTAERIMLHQSRADMAAQLARLKAIQASASAPRNTDALAVAGKERDCEILGMFSPTQPMLRYFGSSRFPDSTLQPGVVSCAPPIHVTSNNTSTCCAHMQREISSVACTGSRSGLPGPSLSPCSQSGSVSVYKWHSSTFQQ